MRVCLVWDYVTSLNIPDLADKLPQESDAVRVLSQSFNTLHYTCFVRAVASLRELSSPAP